MNLYTVSVSGQVAADSAEEALALVAEGEWDAGPAEIVAASPESADPWIGRTS